MLRTVHGHRRRTGNDRALSIERFHNSSSVPEADITESWFERFGTEEHADEFAHFFSRRLPPGLHALMRDLDPQVHIVDVVGGDGQLAWTLPDQCLIGERMRLAGRVVRVRGSLRQPEAVVLSSGEPVVRW
mgnify:CR=1 FL=1